MTAKLSGVTRPIGSFRSLLVVVSFASACTFSPKPPGSAAGGTSGSAGSTGAGLQRGARARRRSPGSSLSASIRRAPSVERPAGQPGHAGAHRAFGKDAGGAEQDVTSKVTWSVDRPLLVPKIAGGVATTSDTVGGVVAVRATSATLGASATLTIKLTSDERRDRCTGATPPLPAAPAPGLRRPRRRRRARLSSSIRMTACCCPRT